MKKFVTFLLVVLTICLVTLVTTNVNVEAADAVMGTNSSDSPWFSAYQASGHGSTRVDETTVNIVGTAGWGYRGGFIDTYNLEDITITADVKNLTDRGVLMLLFSNSPQTYAGEGDTKLVMDILRDSTSNHNYVVTFSKSNHNTSVEGFTNDVPSFHSDYSGVVVTAENDIITIKMKKAHDSVTVSVNEFDINVPTAFDGFTNPQAVYISSGLIETQNINYNLGVVDAERARYYSETGDYGKNKVLIEQYTEALKADLTVEENVNAAKTIRDSIDLTKIKTYDLPRLQPTKEANDAILAKAIEDLGKEDLTPICTDNLKSYRLDKNNDVIITIDTLGQAISTIMVDETALQNDDYNLVDNTLTIAGSALNSLTAGEHEVVITTTGGSVKVNLTVYTGEEFAPTTTTTSINHQLGTSSSASIDFDAKGNSITTVKVNNVEIDGFTVTANSVILENVYLESLAAGEYEVVISTEDGSVTVALTIIAKAAIEDREPVLGSYGSDTDWWSRWQSGAHGVVRTGVTEYKIITTAGWGQRGGFKTAFDITNLEASFDLSTLSNDTVLMMLFSTTDNTYAGEGATQLVIEFVKVSNSTFFVVFSNTPTQAGHSSSIPGFADGSTSDKPGYTGITIDAVDGIVNLKLVQNADSSVTIDVNSETYTIADAYATVSNPTSTYISLGTFMGSGATPVQQYKVNYIYDASLKTYYGETGTFGIAIEKLLELTEAVRDLSTNELLLAAIAINSQIDIAALRAYDYQFIKDDYEKVKTILDDAISANLEILRTVVENAINTAQTAIANLAKIEDIANANDLTKEAKAKLDELAQNEAISADVITALTADYQAAYQELTTKVKTLINEQYDSFVEAVVNVNDVDSMTQALILRDNLVKAYQEMFTEEEWNALIEKRTTASVTLDEKISYANENWDIAGGNGIITNEDMLDIVHLHGDIVYNKEKLDATNFTITFDFSSISGNTGSWFSFGIMENKGRFIVAEDPSVQDNKGILFLITKVTDTQAAVQLYIVTMTSAGFLTSNVGTSINIDLTKEVTFSLKTEQRTTQGVTGNYYIVNVGGTEVNQLISAQTVKLALGTEQTGYLYLASSGSTISSPNAYAIKSINGYKPISDTLVPVEVPTPPTTTDTKKEYQLGTKGSVSYSINTHGLSISSVKVGNTALTSSNYSFNNNVLELKNAYLETLAADTYTLTLETEDGSVSVELVITAAPKESSKGCGCGKGAVIALISGCAAIATLGILILRRKGN